MPMVAGVVLLALGQKKVLEYVGDTGHHHLEDPVKGIGLYALFFGVAIYLLGHVGFKRRTVHRWSISRLITAALTIIAVPLLTKMPALGQLGVLTALQTGLVAYESVRFAQERDRLRHGRTARMRKAPGSGGLLWKVSQAVAAVRSTLGSAK